METERKKPFDAFHSSNSLIKSSSKHTSRSNGSKVGKLDATYDFDELWRGSVSNLMSSENITEDLIKDSIKELEGAMQESKRMLHERDIEIQKLRETMDRMKKEKEKSEDEKYPAILDDYKQTQARVMELECQLRQINQAHAQEVEQLRSQSSNTKQLVCGAGCQALEDLNETKRNLETTRMKYENLKRKVREFRKQIEQEQKEEEEKFTLDGKNMSSCTIQ